MVLTKQWMKEDERGAKGAVELGFLSTTTNRNIACQYSGSDKDIGAIFEIDVGAVDCGASLDTISQYPGASDAKVSLGLCF